ncbi:MAG TPA: low-density lipoprotein receptor class A repeat-containing protein [Kofleriaceae bacterium]|jgi:hypothetical protein|nr:low-density lipoprotein receptor class A repeat-containing protein [Kofleriaceae bacterium]
MKVYTIGTIAVCATLAVACDRGGFTPSGGGLTTSEAEQLINDNLVLPPGSYTLPGQPGTDTTIMTTGSSGGEGDVRPGMPLGVSIPFTAPGGNVIGAGIRIGSTGPIHVVPISGVMGQTSGTLSFDFTVPASVCNDLSGICHSIICNEFAVTAIGQVSASNIRQIAMACGDCDEPSCQSLLMSCMCSGGDFMCSDGSCVPASSVCNTTANCPDGADEDPAICGDQQNCCMATNGCPEETGDSCGSTCCCCPGGQACCADQSGCCTAP